MQKVFTLIYLILLPLVGFSQTDFRPGYIIDNNGDTIKGFIDYKGNKANARKCLFKAGEEAVIQEFTPENLKAYRFINSKYYVSRIILKDSSNIRVFLEYLIDGVVDIYYYRDFDGEHYFAEDENGAFYTLRYEQKEILRDNKLYSVESKEYVGVLSFLFQKDPSAVAEAKNATLTHKSLIDITKDYHNAVCTDRECIIYEKKLPKARLTFGPVMGFQLVKANPQDDLPESMYYLDNCTFEPSYSIYGGLFFKVNIPYFSERLFFHYELCYNGFDLHTQTTVVDVVPFFYLINDVSYKCRNIDNAAMFRYELTIRKVNAAFFAGFYFNYAVTADFYRHLEVQHVSGSTYMEQTFTDNPFAGEDYGIAAGCGLSGKIKQHREYFFDFKYQREFGFTPYLNMNYFIFSAGIHIGK